MQQHESINVQWIEDEKFNDTLINLRLAIPMKEKDRTMVNLLSKMMGDRLENTKTKEAMTRRLDYLYGFKVRSSTYVLGKYLILDLQGYGISQQFVDEPLLEKQIKMLVDMLTQPLLTHELLNEAKKKLIIQHQRLKENHARQAVQNALAHAGKGQVFSLSSMGDLSDLDSIDLEEIKEFHQTMLKNHAKVLTIVGNVEPFDLSDLLAGLGTSSLVPSYQPTKIEPLKIEETHSGSQTELILLYEVDIIPNSKESVAMMLYTSQLGQLPTSLLFQELREKHSLCYSIYANRYVFDGVLMIHTGIDQKNIDQALTLIDVQIETMKNGIENLEGLKQTIITQLNGNTEELQSQSVREFTGLLKNEDQSIDELITIIESIENDDIIAVANKINNPFIYIYKGGHDEEN
ncbi:pitrilysin family protein [Erysipelothrix urinaevulpis]|uniref:M16 family metallopeptidase n=1 Tax=Erysipelothrix urinaevulpis TaxID=2683717 RepID=UPI0013599BA4|nr:insulinase family protein [Erysipelothrix urinaevulpis]